MTGPKNIPDDETQNHHHANRKEQLFECWMARQPRLHGHDQCCRSQRHHQPPPQRPPEFVGVASKGGLQDRRRRIMAQNAVLTVRTKAQAFEPQGAKKNLLAVGAGLVEAYPHGRNLSNFAQCSTHPPVCQACRSRAGALTATVWHGAISPSRTHRTGRCNHSIS